MGGMTCPEEWTYWRYVLTRAGWDVGALVLVVSFAGAGQGVLSGFTSSVAPLVSAFAGMTVREGVR